MGKPSSRSRLVVLSCGAMLILSACGGSSGSSNAAFCKKLSDLSVKYAGLQYNPSKTLIQQAANAVKQLEGSAPSAIESAVKTEAADYQTWASTGDSSSLLSNAFSAADAQISNWTSANCKQGG